MATGHPTRKSWWQSPGVLIFLVLGAVAATQILLKPKTPGQVPGIERGDIRLKREDLSSDCAGWKQVAFTPPEDADQLPDGQYWWVHQWMYTRDGQSAGVCFDQLGLNHWHELTHCYQGLGWTLIGRSVQKEESASHGQAWEYVVADFKRETGEYATLVFSTFYEDGTPADALRIGLDHDWNEKPDLTTGFMNRLTASDLELPKHERALQCQVFSVHTNESKADAVHELTQLHLVSRQTFRDKWLAAKGSSSQNQDRK